MIGEFGPEQVEKILETIAVVDANAQLLMVELKAAKLKVRQMEASFALVVGFLTECADIEGGVVGLRVTEQLRLCADDPALAAQTAGCKPDHIDPAMLRAAAAMIQAADPGARWSPQEQAVTAH